MYFSVIFVTKFCGGFRSNPATIHVISLPLTKPVRKVLQVWSNGQVDAFRNDGGRGASEIGIQKKLICCRTPQPRVLTACRF